MAGATSNADALGAGLLAVADAIAFDRADPLVSAIQGAIAENVRRRTVDGQVTSDGTPLKDLTPGYLRAKAAKGQPETIGVATGAMLDEEQLRGTPSATADGLEVAYGTDEAMRERAGYFEDGGREFYGLDDDGRAAVLLAVRDHLAATMGA